LGKYAASSSGGSFDLSIPTASLLRSHAKAGGGATPRISVSPMLLSPAFLAAAEHQRGQMPAPEQSPPQPAHEAPPPREQAADAYRGHAQAVAPIVERRAIDEESTLELKAQVIYNRQAAEAKERARFTDRAPLALSQPPAAAETFSFRPTAAATTQLPATGFVIAPAAAAPAVTPLVQGMGGAGSTLTAGNTAGRATGADLQRAIAEALSNRTGSTISSNDTTTTTTSARPSASGAFSSGAFPATTGRDSILSARSAATLPAVSSTLSTGKAPLPASVPPLRAIAEPDYSSLPSFIRGQLSLEALNSTAGAVHGAVVRRCAAGSGPGENTH
jgi:hypothetical protein